MINSMSIQHKLYSNINKSVLSHIFDDFEASELFMNLYILIQLSCSSLFFSKLWRRIHNQSTHTLRTVFFFGDRSSTRFCESIPDVFCNERTKQREGAGQSFVLFICVQGTERARAAAWTALDTRVPQTQPRKGNHHDF